MVAYDTGQMRLMLEMLEMFDAGKIPLPDLIHGLEAILGSMARPDESWTTHMHMPWIRSFRGFQASRLSLCAELWEKSAAAGGTLEQTGAVEVPICVGS